MYTDDSVKVPGTSLGRTIKILYFLGHISKVRFHGEYAIGVNLANCNLNAWFL